MGAATTGFMILFTALGGTAKYLTLGKLPWRQLLWFACVGGIGGQTGQRVVRKARWAREAGHAVTTCGGDRRATAGRQASAASRDAGDPMHGARSCSCGMAS